MTGLLLLAAFILWIVVAILIGLFIFRKLPPTLFRLPLVMALTALTVPLPLIDELIGARQFRALCEAAKTVYVDEDKAIGRPVRLREIPLPQLPQYTGIPSRAIRNALVPIRESTWEYIDQQSGEVLFGYKTYAATGGWLIRALGISEGNAPVAFRGYCRPQNEEAIFRSLGLRKVGLSPKREGEK